MRYVRAAALLAVLGSFIAVTGCSGSSSGATPPIPFQDPGTASTSSQSLPGDTTTQGAGTTAGTDTSQSVATEATTTGVPTHVMTAAIVYGYGGTPASVPMSSVTPYLSWVQTDEQHAAAFRAAGTKVDVYVNFWRNYTHDSPNIGYQDLKPGGTHAAAEAKACSGSVIKDPTYGGGYEADARSSAALGHAQVFANYRMSEYAGHYDALFTDDTNAMSGIPLPCNYAISTYIAAVNKVNTALKIPIFFSAFGAVSDPTTQVGLVSPANVLGGMCEICFAGYNAAKVDYVHTGTRWTSIANAEIQTVAKHKIFWIYARAIGNPSVETAIRKYIYASFLLGYDPKYAMLQVAFTTAHGFPIMPETGFVPMNPLTTATSVTGYKRGNVYMREFGACYYRGVNKGKCAVVVNPGTTTESVPSTGYNHSLVLSGSGVLDGGAVSFTGARVTSLASANGAILLP